MRNRFRFVVLQLCVWIWVGFSLPVDAQFSRIFTADEADEEETVEEAEPERRPPPAEGSVEMDADRLEYDADREVLIGIGNVVVRQHGDTLRADYLEVHTQTQEAFARGNVFFDRDGRTWEGEEFSYNLETREGDFGEFHAYNDPYHIRARDSRQVARNKIEMDSPRITTCDTDDRQEFVIRARRASIEDESILRAHHVVTFLYGVPIFYTPYYKKDFSKKSNIDIMPGYRSRFGAFLLTAYSYYPIPEIKATTHLDYRDKRGFGYGQQVRWRMPERNARGLVRGYYTSDDRPIRSEGQREIREGLIDSDRYWLSLSNVQGFGARNALFTELNYVSDPFVLEDFFDDEFRRGVQPENRVTFTHRGDNFTAALLLNARLNDFYGNVNRLPEASLDVSRQQILTSPLYYESEHSAAYLERVFPKQRPDQVDFDAFRVDSSHTVLYPMRHFGFLSVIPSIGYRGTWYSETPGFRTSTNLVPRTDAAGEFERDEEGNVLFDEVSEVVPFAGPAELRNLMTYKVETSFKAFRVFNERPNYLGEGLRHLAEPYAEYTFVPEPNQRPDDLYQFDAIDALDERHDITLGIRNKLQTRRPLRAGRSFREELNGRVNDLEEEEDELPEGTRVHDFIDLNVFTVYFLDPEPEQNSFSDVFFDARLRLTDWMRIDFDGAYDWDENEIRRFNTQWAFIGRDRSTLSLEYRYDRDRRQTLQSEVVLFPRARWSYSAYWRYDLENNDLEEHSYLVQRRFDCTMLGVGVRGRLDEDDETEWRAWAQISLLAFPDTELRLGR